mgnify:CR=1 FL=1
MSDLIKYNPDDPLFSEDYLESLYSSDYRKFKELANYLKENDIKVFNNKFLPIITRKMSSSKVDSGYDTFDNSFRGNLRNNKIEFIPEWELNASLHVSKRFKSFILFIDVAYMGSNFNIKFDKKYTVLGLKADNEIKYFRPVNTTKRKFDATRYYTSAYFTINAHELKNLIYSREVQLKINSELEDHLFDLTYATLYGLEKFYKECINVLENKE